MLEIESVWATNYHFDRTHLLDMFISLQKKIKLTNEEDQETEMCLK